MIKITVGIPLGCPRKGRESIIFPLKRLDVVTTVESPGYLGFLAYPELVSKCESQAMR